VNVSRARPGVEPLETRLVPSGVDVVSGDPKDWPMYNHDLEGTRSNPAETRLSPATVGGLHTEWSFPTLGQVAGTPAVVGDRVYAADASGTAYALDRDGHLIWSSHVAGPVTASALVTNRTVIFGDLGGTVYGLDVDTGAERWSVRPNPHPFASIFGSPTMVGHDVAIGIASIEELVALTPGYVPTFRGSVVLLDPSDGRVVWQTYTVSDAESAAGASGAGVWSTPTYDRPSNTLYVTSGNNYSDPTNGLSDAIIALDAATGRVRWANQRTQDDDWNFSFPNTGEHVDFDFGDSAQIYRVGGRKVVGAGQKSGFYHVVDAATGATVNQVQVSPGGELSGLFADSAVAGGVVYANTSDWPNGFQGGAPVEGGLSAIAGDGSCELWHFHTPFSPNISGTAVANGVVYFQSVLNGNLYALDARTGALLATVATGGQASGPSISRGQVYLGLGNVFALLANLQNVLPGAIVALGVDDGGHGHGRSDDSSDDQFGQDPSSPAGESNRDHSDGGADAGRRRGLQADRVESPSLASLMAAMTDGQAPSSLNPTFHGVRLKPVELDAAPEWWELS
jgi:polyvinyl alcohol dehydrogenase (cytochrome)